MLVLCGLPISNYYNKVKLALLEKGIAFEEEHLGMAGVGAKSQAIVEYLEDSWPEPPLLPQEPYAAAKVRELIAFVDLHLELVARELYPRAFFGGSLGAGDAARVKTLLSRNVAAFRRLARFDPYVAGAQFTLADCAAWASLPVVAMATKAIYGEDLLAAGGVEIKGYQRFVGERPSAQRVTADRKAWQERAAAKG